MKKITIFYVLLFGLMNLIPLKAQQQITIGTGTSTWYYSPITRLFEHGASETIYDASEIGTTGTINSVGWNIISNAFATPTGNVSIYMKMSTQATVSASTTTTGYTLVYSGNVPNNVLGWQNIALTTPFQYDDATKNLVVLVVHASGDYTLSPPNYSYSSAPNKSSYYYSISSPWSNNTSMTSTPNRSNIRLSLTNLSTIDIEGKTSVRFYPNPVKGFFHIAASQPVSSVEIFSLSGQNVLSQKFDSNAVTLNLSHLMAGNYIAKIQYRDGSSKSVKVIKQ